MSLDIPDLDRAAAPRALPLSAFPDVVLFTPRRFHDARGFFSETFSQRNLQSLGIEMQDDGTLQVDSSALNDALTNDYQDFQNFFQSSSPNGFGNYFANQMVQMTDPTLGPVALAVNGLQQENQSLTDDINNFEAQMTVEQQELTQQYSALNATLEEYPSLMQEIASQLDSLPGSTSSSSSSSGSTI